MSVCLFWLLGILHRMQWHNYLTCEQLLSLAQLIHTLVSIMTLVVLRLVNTLCHSTTPLPNLENKTRRRIERTYAHNLHKSPQPNNLNTVCHSTTPLPNLEKRIRKREKRKQRTYCHNLHKRPQPCNPFA